MADIKRLSVATLERRLAAKTQTIKELRLSLRHAEASNDYLRTEWTRARAKLEQIENDDLLDGLDGVLKHQMRGGKPLARVLAVECKFGEFTNG